MAAADHFDVLIIGAGISGIGAACHLTRECPDKSFAILERRQAIGGTWDLFRYPGIRSDSDMYTFGFAFRPWRDTRTLADGASIREYVRDTAAEHGVDDHIRFGVKVERASWSTAAGRWTVETVDEAAGESHTYTADFLLGATGYYNYDAGYRPEFPGQERFGGQVVHPQHWPEDLDYAGKRIVIIGSGATAVTLVPAMADSAAHITMLQRSPTYIVSLPAVDAIAEQLGKRLPDALAYKLARAKNVAVQRASYALARRKPDLMRRFVLRGAEKQLAGASDIANFTPTYNPWDQRLCVVPNGDLFRTIREGGADVVTDAISTFDETGIQLESGTHLDADIIITATGLDVQMVGGAQLIIDGEPLQLKFKVTYKAVLVEDVPNAAIIFGYTNASWTLKADLAAVYFCRLLKHMDAHGHTQFVVHATDADRADESALSALKAGYVQRGNDRLPRQGTHGPWKVTNDYLRDIPTMRRAAIDDGVLQFTDAPRATPDDEPTRTPAAQSA
ncbi:flavin-containing monooxygenase [uncultured Jatrophihabitans sp.]|uniref:flavin-containing monooxygenase n=1 Tax=uncultured Jatrophihabitans sp. TaxID=1610747 RepID=UPI0035CB237B